MIRESGKWEFLSRVKNYMCIGQVCTIVGIGNKIDSIKAVDKFYKIK